MVILIMFAHALPVFIVALFTEDSIKTNRIALLSAVIGMVWGSPIYILLDWLAIGIALWMVNPYVRHPDTNLNQSDNEVPKKHVPPKHAPPDQPPKPVPNEYRKDYNIEEQSIVEDSSKNDSNFSYIIVIICFFVSAFLLLEKTPGLNAPDKITDNQEKNEISPEPVIETDSEYPLNSSVTSSGKKTVKFFDNDLRKVQRALKKKGYYDGELDGVYGPKTEDAIRRFQINRVIPVTGKADFNTIRALGY